MENPRTSEAQARSGPGRNTGETSLRLAINCHSAMKPAATAKLATAPEQSAVGLIAAVSAQRGAAEQAALRHHQQDVERVADDADPDQIGQHQVGAQRLLRQHDAGAEADRVDRDFDGDGDDQRDAGGEPERDEDARQRGGDDDLPDPLRRRQPQRARDLHQPRLDAAHRGPAQDQDRPDAGKGDDDDFHPVAEAERDQRDRQQRDRRDRPDRLDRHFHQAVERVGKAEGDAERQADDAADREAGEGREQRVAGGGQDREIGKGLGERQRRSGSAAPGCRFADAWRAPRSRTPRSNATGSTSALAVLPLTARSP